jgi:hypothetical protein
MLTLKKSAKFQTEVNEFQQSISRIKIDKNKRQAQQMLNELINHVNLINNGHASEHDGNVNPHTIRENVVELQRLRYSLKNFLKGA